ncbi:MAG: ECF transporter S component [Clostridia bacterium]|nr:ECF transporter S component [Clostridia bacterium]
MNSSRFFTARNITSFAILLALVIVLQTFGGAINIGPVQLNFTLIPIALGAILLGPLAGGILGLACGIVVTIQVIMGLVPFYVLIWTETPVVALLTCVVKTTVAGYLSGLIYKLLVKKNRYVAVFVAAAIVPVVNTALFIVGCLAMWDVMVSMAGGTNILAFILVSLVTFNFFAELGVNLLCAPALFRVIKVIDKNGVYGAVEMDSDNDFELKDNTEDNTDKE